MQKYPKSTSTQKVSGTGTASFLEYPCFIASLLVVGSESELNISVWHYFTIDKYDMQKNLFETLLLYLY